MNYRVRKDPMRVMFVVTTIALLALFVTMIEIPRVHAQSATYPIGIVADGYSTENKTGFPYKIDVPYEINTNAIMGAARINSIQVDPPDSGASLQLNVVLHAITTSGATDYWLQNVLDFPNTDYQNANFVTNIWNMTDVKNNSKICPNLNPFEYILCKIRGPYIKSSNSFTYQLPFAETIIIYEQIIPQKGVKILLGYDGDNGERIYVNKTIPIPNIISASLLVTSNTIQNQYLDDAEFVFGGMGNGKVGNFSSMDSTLYLFYNDTGIQVPENTSQSYLVNSWKPFSGYTTDGYDTAETAYNIYSTLSPNNNGTAFIKLGTIIQNISPTPNSTSTQIPSQTNQQIISIPPLSVSTDNQSYTKGDMIRIYGQISNVVPSIPLTIRVLDPYNDVVQTYQANIQPLLGPHVDNSTVFEDYIQTGSNLWKYAGTYTIEAHYGSSPPVQTTFNLNMDMQPVAQPTPQTVNPSYPSFLSITSTYMLDNNDINYGIPNGKIVNMELQPESKSISIETESTETSPLTVDLPESLIKFNAEPQIFVDGIETGYSYKVKTQDGIALSIGIPSGDHKTEIIGSQVIPEFGSLALIVFLIGIVTTLTISSKLRSEITLRSLQSRQ